MKTPSPNFFTVLEAFFIADSGELFSGNLVS